MSCLPAMHIVLCMLSLQASERPQTDILQSDTPVPMPIMKAPAIRAFVKLSMPPPPFGLPPVPLLLLPLPSLPRYSSVDGL